jgi:hypothetical protein
MIREKTMEISMNKEHLGEEVTLSPGEELKGVVVVSTFLCESLFNQHFEEGQIVRHLSYGV